MGTIADFKQTNSAWSRVAYAGDTIGGSGCGPTACANIIHYTHPSETPKTVCAWAQAHGCASNGYGTYHAGIVNIMKHYGFECTMSDTTTGKKTSAAEDEWKKQMKTGKYLGILLMSKPISGVNSYKWTGSGHYITAVSWDGSNVLIHDPASTTRTGKHPWSHLDGLVKRFYLIKKPAEKKETKPAATTAATTNVVSAKYSAGSFNSSLAGTYKVTTPLNMRNCAGTSSDKCFVLVVLPKDVKVRNYGYYSMVNGAKWLLVQVTIGTTKYTGFCHSAYLKKV